MEVKLNHPAAQTRLPLSEQALCAWVGRANPGDRLVYHRGLLAFDAGPDNDALTLAARQQLRLVADRAWVLAQDGLVQLVQRREGEGVYAYTVIARLRPRRDTGALQAVLDAAGVGKTETAPSDPADAAGPAL